MLSSVKTLVAKDGSKNYILSYGKSFIEARYVRRAPNYISIYVSSHNGCKMGCKFCWLTQQNQTNFKHVGLKEYDDQLRTVLEGINEKEKDKKAIRININFMARGECLANKSIVNNYSELYKTLNETVIDYGYKEIKMNLSTIMPNTVNQIPLYNIFKNNCVNIYYSLYSVDEKFKKIWMPNAMNWKLALDKLAEFQQNQNTNKNNNIVFHGAFIKGYNDKEEDALSIVKEIKARNFSRTKFNLVRLNPPKGSNIVEADEEQLQKIFKIITEGMNDEKLNKKSTIINRVGLEAYASCGTFPNDLDL
jgi:adenine C2-methylase RlmN of 23S rRNA A2503 and tRNA A37